MTAFIHRQLAFHLLQQYQIVLEKIITSYYFALHTYILTPSQATTKLPLEKQKVTRYVVPAIFFASDATKSNKHFQHKNCITQFCSCRGHPPARGKSDDPQLTQVFHSLPHRKKQTKGHGTKPTKAATRSSQCVPKFVCIHSCSPGYFEFSVQQT